MLYRALLLLAILGLTGCFGPPVWKPLRPGDDVTWPGAILNEPIHVPRGARLVLPEGVTTPGPITVEGELVLSRRLEFSGGRESAVIQVVGGRATVERIGTGTLDRIEASDGANVTLLNLSFVPQTITATGSSSLRIENSTIQQVEGSDAIRATGSEVWIVNTTIAAFDVVSEGTATIRLTNVAIALQHMLGSGTIERAWHVKARVAPAVGSALADRYVVAYPASRAGPRVEAMTGTDGIAYLEVVELRRVGGQVDILTPHVFESNGGRAVAIIDSEEEEVSILIV